MEIIYGIIIGDYECGGIDNIVFNIPWSTSYNICSHANDVEREPFVYS